MRKFSEYKIRLKNRKHKSQENLCLLEKNPISKGPIRMISFIQRSQNDKLIKTEN